MSATWHSRQSLVKDLRLLGVVEGMALIVHTSLKKVGQVIGGAAAVVLALEDALGDGGTLVMPTQTEQLCDPAELGDRYPVELWPTVREHMPLYYPDLTPTAHMGFVAETFRKQEGTRRSDHPHVSFAARGPRALEIVADHGMHYALGEDSPLQRLYDLGGHILLLGAPKDSNTSLHLAEYSQENTFVQSKDWDVKLLLEGEERWVRYRDINNESEDFGRIFDDFERDVGCVRVGRVGDAVSYLVPMREMVDYAVGWMNRERR